MKGYFVSIVAEELIDKFQVQGGVKVKRIVRDNICVPYTLHDMSVFAL